MRDEQGCEVAREVGKSARGCEVEREIGQLPGRKGSRAVRKSRQHVLPTSRTVDACCMRLACRYIRVCVDTHSVGEASGCTRNVSPAEVTWEIIIIIYIGFFIYDRTFDMRARAGLIIYLFPYF